MGKDVCPLDFPFHEQEATKLAGIRVDDRAVSNQMTRPSCIRT